MSDARKEIHSFYEKSIYISQIEIIRLYRINLPCVDSTNIFCLMKCNELKNAAHIDFSIVFGSL